MTSKDSSNRTFLTSPRSSNGETRVLEPIGFLALVQPVGRDGREVRRGVEVGDATRARSLRARRDARERRERPAEHRGVRGDTRSAGMLSRLNGIPRCRENPVATSRWMSRLFDCVYERGGCDSRQSFVVR